MPLRIAYEVREQIITGELAMGSRLNEREIAERLAVSRVPVREALPILEAEGFITTAPRRGATVSVFTLTDARELFDLRELVEPRAAEIAAQRVAAGADPAILHEALGAARPEVSTSAGTPASTRNSDLHETIIELADHALLRRVTGFMSGRTRWLFRITPERDSSSMWCEHRDMVDAIAAGNAELARLVSAAHVERGRLESMPLLEDRLPEHAPAPKRRRRAPGA